MPDAYSQITTAKPAVVSVLIDAMELRAADPQQRVIRERFLNEVAFPDTARVLEAGCGSGAICRELARWPQVGEVVGLGPSTAFLTKARELAAGYPTAGSMRPMRVRCPTGTRSSMRWSSTRA